MIGRIVLCLIAAFIVIGFLMHSGPGLIFSALIGVNDLEPRQALNSRTPNAEDVTIAAPFWTLRPNCELTTPAANARIYAASVHEGGMETPVQEFRSVAGQVDVTVTDTSAPVFLLLAGRNAVIWNIRLAPNARLAGVVTTGTDRQLVVAKQSRVPVLPVSAVDTICKAKSVRDENSYAVFEAVSADEMKKISKAVFGRAPDNIVAESSPAEVLFGPELTAPLPAEPGPFAIPDIVVDKHRPILFGRPALQRLVAEGAIAPATEADMTKWRSAGPLSENLPDYMKDLDLARAFVVKMPFRLPLGLTGEAASAFILPAGMQRPEGSVGENVFLKYTPFGCASAEVWNGNCNRKDFGSFAGAVDPFRSLTAP